MSNEHVNEPTKDEEEAADRSRDKVSDDALQATKEAYEKGADVKGEGEPENPGGPRT